MITAIGHSGKGKSMKTVERSAVVRVKGMNRQSTEDFQGSENTMYDTIMVDTFHFTSV